ncbi:MAG: Nuclease inhibitor from bacteriophage T4 [Rhodobacteraceae bacterium HLUCCO07]|nr:MAG: Nuclease inhibitor from bacteriophage T4 [Rhodobacteraceae bacterium HLUCCO07]
MSEQTGSPRRIQTWADWQAAVASGNCTEAEKALVAACRAGRECILGDGTRPAGPSPARDVGADLLRYLIKGGCDACDLHDLGVGLIGAWITGALDLALVRAAGVTVILNCHFEKPIDAINARLDTLALNGSICPALNAQGAEVKGGVFLRGGFVAEGEVRLATAVIGGQLVCKGGRFENAWGKALNAEGAEVKGDVFLSEGFAAKGAVSLSGAVISGQLSCEGGRFENAGGDALNAQGAAVKGDVFLSEGFAAKGEVSLSGAVIGGQLACKGGRFENAGGHALNAQSAEVNALLWHDVEHCDGSLTLAGAKAQSLMDDAASWVMVHRAYLDGFAYQIIHGPLDAQMRLEWLEKAYAYDDGFSPQPYEQLASALKRMGHDEQRRVVLIEKEKRQRRHERGSLRFQSRLARLVSRLSKAQDKASVEAVRQQLKERDGVDAGHASRLLERFILFHDSWPEAQKDKTHPTEIARAQAGFREEIFWHNARIRMRIAWLQIKDRMARHLVGYGYRPFNFVLALVLLIGIGWMVAHLAYEQGDFAPNSDVILSTRDWQALAEGGSANPARDWAAGTGKGRDYETFSSFAYAVDVVIPIVSIGQEAAWTPSTNRGPWGATLWWLRWFLTISGWIVTAVGAAAITGIIRRE